jgi:alkanesulfonate monooxygenase SsuD/methylene tetrahydromethanopterin reductase-like flavin-dependent oxidoreductase (luciferase family)
VRIGVVLPEPDAAAQAEDLGFDVAWINEEATPAPLVAAAWLAARTRGIRIAAEVIAGPHPVALAEEAAVADLATGGRLILAMRGDDEELLGETVDLLVAALAARPFVHEGARWRVPARLPEHQHVEERLRVTPAPAQLELPVWVTGAAGRAVARSRAVPFAGREERGLASGRVRPAIRVIDSDDPDVIVDRLLAERNFWGLDTVVLDAPRELWPLLAGEVRARLQLDQTPAGLVRHLAEWRSSTIKQ